MSQPLLPQPTRTDRVLFRIPNFDYFANILHERLYAIFKHYEEWDSPVMFITNLYDRDTKRVKEREETKPDDFEALIYAGTERQRYLLEQYEPLYYKGYRTDWTEEKRKDFLASLAPNWKYLKDRLFDRSMQKADTLQTFDEYRNGEVGFGKIQIGTLKAYFENLDNPLQENEHPIISAFFDVENDLYIGIPLLGMGLFQGVVWIIFKKEEQEKLQDARTIRRIIKYFQVEFDNITLDWDVVGENITKESTIDQVFKNITPTNPILSEVNLVGYYQQSTYYHDERVKQSDDAVRTLKTQFAKT